MTSDAFVSFPVALSIVYVATVSRSWFPTAKNEPHGDNAKSRGPAAPSTTKNCNQLLAVVTPQVPIVNNVYNDGQLD